jgi:thymidylate synthase (FAD)
MQIIPQSYEILDTLDYNAILAKLELCGRVCYKSESKISDTSAEKFVANIIKSGHESVLEHVNFSVRFITDRGVTHEIVRHRIASYSQESTRYCNYSGEMTFIKPYFADNLIRYPLWLKAMGEAEAHYKYMIDSGAKPQEARSVLPNSLKTELIMTANLREWRHFFRLRTSEAAHPQLRELALDLERELKMMLPIIF